MGPQKCLIMFPLNKFEKSYFLNLCMYDKFNFTDKIQFTLMVWSCPAEIIPSGSCCMPSIWWVIFPEQWLPRKAYNSTNFPVMNKYQMNLYLGLTGTFFSGLRYSLQLVPQNFGLFIKRPTENHNKIKYDNMNQYNNNHSVTTSLNWYSQGALMISWQVITRQFLPHSKLE